MKKRVKMKMFKGAQLLWKLIKNRQRNVRRARKVPFGRNKWISAVILQTLLSAVFPWTHTFHIRVVVQASGPSFYQFLPHSLPAPLMVMLRCRLERYALRLWRSASLCQPHHIIFFFLYFALCAKLFQSHLTLCNPLDCSPPGSSVHGILTVKISYSHHAGFLFNYLFILQFESLVIYDIVLCCSVAKLDPTLCNLMDCSISGFPILHCLLEFAQVHVH